MSILYKIPHLCLDLSCGMLYVYGIFLPKGVPMKKTNRSRGKIILAMVIWGTIAPFVRQIGISSQELALYRACLAAAVVGVYLLLSGQPVKPRCSRRDLLLLILSGMAMGFNWILLFQAYRYTTVAAATLSYYFAPVLVILACPLVFRERVTKKQALCFLMSTLGLILVIGAGVTGSGTTDMIGIAFGLGAAVLYASVVMLNKFITGVSGIHRTFLQFLAAAMTLVPYVLITCDFTLHTPDAPGWICLLILGTVHSGLAYCLYFSSLKDVSGQQAAILSYIDPLVAVVVGVILLSEPISWQQILGGGLILGFTLFNEL